MFSLSQIFQFRKIIIKGNVFVPNKRLTCFENEVKRYRVQTTVNVKKRERRASNLSVKFLCSTLDLLCAVKNVEESV